MNTAILKFLGIKKENNTNGPDGKGLFAIV